MGINKILACYLMLGLGIPGVRAKARVDSSPVELFHAKGSAALPSGLITIMQVFPLIYHENLP